MSTHEADRNLAARIVRGERGAAERLFERLFEPLYRQVCARLGGDHNLAEDVVGEALLSGLRGLSRFRGETSLESWFVTIALRKIADQKRGRAARLVVEGNGALEALLAARSGVVETPLADLGDVETRELVREALDGLPHRHRDVLRWKYYDDESLAQLARRLNVTTKAAERRLARAREALAGALRHRGLAR